MTRVFIGAGVVVAVFACTIALTGQMISARAQPTAAPATTLFDELWGFGVGTTGGLGGQLYVVTRTDDPWPTVPGTLRYGVETLGGPTWIVFDERAFPAATRRIVYLRSTLSLRSDLTIDGRGSHVSLRRVYDLSHVNWDRIDSDTWQCVYEAAHKWEGGPIMELRSVQNVIITHLEFLQEYRNAIDDPGVPDISNYTQLDTECFGDVISIFNPAGLESVQEYDNIWINHSNFSSCGDECIGVTHPNTTKRAYLTFSSNMFIWSYKGILLGGLSTDTPFMIAASVYRNRFVGVNRRQPRVGKAYAHVFNNIYEDWRASAVAAASYSRVIVEHNVFRPITRTENSLSVEASGIDVRLWAKFNIYGIPGSDATPTFPACGSAWYYQCDVPKIDISRMSYSAARDTLRPLGGWLEVANDVLSCASCCPASRFGSPWREAGATHRREHHTGLLPPQPSSPD